MYVYVCAGVHVCVQPSSLGPMQTWGLSFLGGPVTAQPPIPRLEKEH